MEYLASEKAYDLSVSMDQKGSNGRASAKKLKYKESDDIDKIYG